MNTEIEAEATIALFNGHVAPAAFTTQTSIGGAIIAASSAGAATSKAQRAALDGVSSALSNGIEAAAELQVCLCVMGASYPHS